METMALTKRLQNFAIVLNRPLIPENIGAAARAACNMGISRLVVVNPENPDPERMRRMATHEAAHLIEGMSVYGDLKVALANYGYVVGMTARTGGDRKPVISPRELANGILEYADTNHVALLFGSEDRGLTNEEIRFCHQLVRIPTADFSSLNLAQAVMVICYEVYLASQPLPDRVRPPLATSEQLELMFEKVRDILIKISFIQPENPEHWMMHIRRFLFRVGLQPQEANLIMGLCRQVDWFGNARLQEAKAVVRAKKNLD